MLQLRRSPRLIAARLAASQPNAPYAAPRIIAPYAEEPEEKSECHEACMAAMFMTTIFTVYLAIFYHVSLVKGRGF
jgi:hypothetical protein